MSAEVVPFPTVRRRSMILRNAHRFADLRNPDKALRRLVDGVRQAHEREGIAPELVDSDTADFETALRAHMARFRVEYGGAA